MSALSGVQRLGKRRLLDRKKRPDLRAARTDNPDGRRNHHQQKVMRQDEAYPGKKHNMLALMGAH